MLVLAYLVVFVVVGLNVALGLALGDKTDGYWL